MKHASYSGMIAGIVTIMFCCCGSARAATACGVLQSVDWGFETWTMGSKSFNVTIGDGLHDVKVTAMYGYLSANAHGNQTSPDYQRQSLVTFTYAGASSSVNGSAAAAPDAYSISEVDGNFLAINVKQKGKAGVHLPINVLPPIPVTIPGGKLTAIVNNVTYGADIVITSPQEESIDVEVHVVIWFTEGC